MIEKFKIEDLDSVMKIWVDTNISAHNFIDDNYWKKNYDYVKKNLANSYVLVFKNDEIIKGFVGIVENYIAGIFVENKYQNQKIGQKLLDFCKEEFSYLTLGVYKKNIKAIKFYEKNGFKIVSEKLEIENNELELEMIWKKKV